jgi:hypothetical protein
MRTRQNSASSIVPKLGISRGVPADASSIGILSDQWESKGLRHRRSQLLIANLELEFHLIGCKTNHMQFSNRKFSAIFHCRFPGLGASRLTCPEQAPCPRGVTHHSPALAAIRWAANRDTAIRISRNPNKHTTLQNSNRDKNGTFNPPLLAFVRVLLRPRIPPAYEHAGEFSAANEIS